MSELSIAIGALQRAAIPVARREERLAAFWTSPQGTLLKKGQEMARNTDDLEAIYWRSDADEATEEKYLLAYRVETEFRARPEVRAAQATLDEVSGPPNVAEAEDFAHSKACMDLLQLARRDVDARRALVVRGTVSIEEGVIRCGTCWVNL